MASIMKTKTGITTIVVLLLVLGLGAYVWAGGYNIAADAPHWSLTHKFLQAVRDRSIAARARGVSMPNLADKDLVALGAEHYSAMCSGCHLAPGINDTEIRTGLYPLPPNLATSKRPPAEQFWIIKHGIKMSGMPAWGKTHDDEAIWGLVAFLRQLPDLNVTEYATLTGSSEEAMHDHAEHENASEDPASHDHADGAHDGDATSDAAPAITTSKPTEHTHDHKHSHAEGANPATKK